jgi:hypothetical protein
MTSEGLVKLLVTASRDAKTVVKKLKDAKKRARRYAVYTCEDPP